MLLEFRKCAKGSRGSVVGGEGTAARCFLVLDLGGSRFKVSGLSVNVVLMNEIVGAE